MNKSITISNVDISSRFFLAPLAGYTDLIMRRICREFGAGLLFTEMVSAAALARGVPKNYKYMENHDIENPLALQLFGNNEDDFAKSVSVNDLSSFSFIDINMGCPVRKVIKNGAGSALLDDPQKMYRVVKAIKDNTDIPVSAKIRFGMKRDSIDNVMERVKALTDAGVSFISVHARWTSDMFKYTFSDLDWDSIGLIKESVNVPVIASGDVLSVQNAKYVFEKTKVDGIMIGRGAVGSPWIFSELNTIFDDNNDEYILPTPQEKINISLRHLNECISRFGEDKGIRYMRKFFVKYLNDIGILKKYRNIFLGLNTHKEIVDFLNNIDKYI